MGRIQSNIGLITGIPIQETVNQLLAVSAQPRDLLVSRNKALQQEQVAVTELTARVLAVQFAAEKLAKASLFQAKAAASSNPAALSAVVTGSPVSGSRQFTPVRQASSHQLLSGGVASLTDPLGAGSLSFRFGGYLDEAVNLDALNGGAGVHRGKIRITDRAGGAAVIDLRYAQTIDDVLAAINDADAIAVTAVADGDRLKLIDASGGAGSLRVQEVGGGSTASDLGLAGIDTSASQASGEDVLRLSASLQLSQLNDGLGVRLREGVPDLAVTLRDGSALSVDFLQPGGEGGSATVERTLGDLLETINAVDPTRLRAEISADGDRLTLVDLTSGDGEFTVASAAGGRVAEDLGLTAAAVDGQITGGRLLGGLKTSLLSRLAGGAGLGALGELQITDRSGASASIDLSSSATLDDVVRAINGAGVGVQAQVNDARNGLVVRDTTGGAGSLILASGDDDRQTAEKLQIAVNSAVKQVDSGSLRLKVVGENTRLDSLHGGKGINRGQFIITAANGVAKVFDLRPAAIQTVGDLIEAINDAQIGVAARINDAGDGVALIDTTQGSGSLSVKDVGSGRSARDLGFLAEAEEVEIDGQAARVINGSTSYKVEIGAEDSLEDLIAKINALGAPVSAGSLRDGSGATPHRLVLTSQVSGKAGALQIDASQTSLRFAEIAPAHDALLLVGSANSAGVLASSANNKFDSLLDGVSLTVGAASGETVTISVSATDSSVVSAVKAFVDSYNMLRESLKKATFFNEADQTVGTLFGSNEALRIDTELSNLLSGRFNLSGEIRSLAEIGVSINQDGTLVFDSAKLSSQFAANSAAVEEFFTDKASGMASRLVKLVDTLAGAGSSMLVDRAGALARKMEINNERIDFQNRRLERERERLLKYFYNLELSMGKMQNNINALNNLQIIPPLSFTRGAQ